LLISTTYKKCHYKDVGKKILKKKMHDSIVSEYKQLAKIKVQFGKYIS
jgi:hypothetical protein